MPRPQQSKFDHRRVELDGIEYVIMRKTVFEQLCKTAGVAVSDRAKTAEDLALDRGSLSDKLIRRRRAAGLSQAELARRAGIRPETLNRIERGHTTPDFATVRKLVVAINAAESEHAQREMAKQ